MKKMSDVYAKKCAENERKLNALRANLTGIPDQDADLQAEILEVEGYGDYLADEYDAWLDAETQHERSTYGR